MISATLGAAAVLLLGGCYVIEPAYLANGVKVARITCAMELDSVAQCYKAAGDLCGPRGFILFDWDGRPWALPYPDPASLVADSTRPYADLLVACRA